METTFSRVFYGLSTNQANRSRQTRTKLLLFRRIFYFFRLYYFEMLVLFVKAAVLVLAFFGLFLLTTHSLKPFLRNFCCYEKRVIY